ncbi:MAG: 4-(cytidine 5'-diphospho)-2-C-methyl-D-erythritol kinase, partial [Bacteroidales bacterium]|nr:4-(cytidine 5'-diphospho)-2-C-methyl-D-erythritol kinase [Bacteroidales bacterium]
LRLLNDYFSLGIIEIELEKYAARLGSDCPAMLYKRPHLATGRGEFLTPFEIDLSGLYILVCKPSVFISTAQAYAQSTPKKPKHSLRDLLSLPVKEWAACIVNDFETTLFPEYPILREYKEKLYAFGALYASLSGSGSALYGIFESKEDFIRARRFFGEQRALVW